MDRLREAILAVLEEDMDMVAEPVETTRDLIKAWNDLPDVEPIEIPVWGAS